MALLSGGKTHSAVIVAASRSLLAVVSFFIPKGGASRGVRSPTGSDLSGGGALLIPLGEGGSGLSLLGEDERRGETRRGDARPGVKDQGLSLRLVLGLGSRVRFERESCPHFSTKQAPSPRCFPPPLFSPDPLLSSLESSQNSA